MKKGTLQVLSFLGGLTLAAVTISVVLSKNPTLRKEIENQVTSVVKTTRSLVDAYKNIASKSQTVAGFIKSDAGEKSASTKAAEAEESKQVSTQWDTVETQMQATEARR